jgi:hypothetical protein
MKSRALHMPGKACYSWAKSPDYDIFNYLQVQFTFSVSTVLWLYAFGQTILVKIWKQPCKVDICMNMLFHLSVEKFKGT